MGLIIPLAIHASLNNAKLFDTFLFSLLLFEESFIRSSNGELECTFTTPVLAVIGLVFNMISTTVKPP